MKAAELLTTAILDQLLINGLSNEVDHPPVVKLFTPDANATCSSAKSIPTTPTDCSASATSASALRNSATSRWPNSRPSEDLLGFP